MPIYQGTLYSRAFTLKSAATGTALNIEGWTFRCQIRKSVLDTNPLIELTTEQGGIFVHDGAIGVMMFTLDETQTELLNPGSYKFDVMRTDAESGGGPTFLFGGKIKVKKPITRD